MGHLMREENSTQVEQWGEGRGQPCVYVGTSQVFWLQWQTCGAEHRKVSSGTQPMSVGSGQFIILPPCTKVASQYVAMEREWGNAIRPMFMSLFCHILTELPGTIFPTSQNLKFFISKIVMMPTS